ncbi:MAG: exodeoxyribonuclease VII small subunit [Rhodospirillaceae bacterium]|jgi:exodeoxyribonuclease VII small subunit|nr:exodeoxyribonuclease VII small subunit [Rhodospirillaceae bacterium]MBT3551786.1 exodeoxyribonuclease VII small subunit [Rhodospirillaceae bacterium]MBT3885772.1 exodeoxyribonuclease VII small subunit [Rhodospirillaceae bacterium]MBT4118561.1 exodeoxyribonuclease VII small subunit [Rhodospirillaceae bacterium]MBT4672665.1 exodeoxyribonuclease VII small subunit [Rhodospirillaceae bacterium]
MSEEAIPKDIEKLSFEEALEELEAIVEALEQGSGLLDDAIKAYERGTYLKKHCDTKLRAARERVDKINIGAGGEPVAEKMESE